MSTGFRGVRVASRAKVLEHYAKEPNIGSQAMKGLHCTLPHNREAQRGSGRKEQRDTKGRALLRLLQYRASYSYVLQGWESMYV